MFSVMLCLIDRLHIKDKKSDCSLVFGSLMRNPTSRHCGEVLVFSTLRHCFSLLRFVGIHYAQVV